MPPTKKVVKKTIATKKAVKATKATRAAPKTARAKTSDADLARRAIKKHTGQESITANFSTYPHIPSGSYAIDDLIGGSLTIDGKGRICPGYPRKRLTEMYGPESSGKTTVALHAIAEAQKAGGLAMFLDFEHALDHSYAKRLGVSFDADRLLLYAPYTYEQGIQIINIGLQAGVDIIVADSVPSMVPKEEMEAKLDKESRFGALARAMGKNLPKLVAWLNTDKYLARNPEGTAVIFLNQERANIGSTRGDKTKTTGGYPLKFYSSLRLKFNGVGRESVRRKNRLTGKEVSVPYGTITQVKVVKNKIDSRQGQVHTIFIRYGHGIDEHYSLIEAALFHGIIRKSGSFLSFKDRTIQGREQFRRFLKDHPAIFEELRAMLVSVLQGDVEEAGPEEILSEAEVMERSGFDEEFSGEEDIEVRDDEVEVNLDEDDIRTDPDPNDMGADPDPDGMSADSGGVGEGNAG